MSEAENVKEVPGAGWTLRLGLRFGVGMGVGYGLWLWGLHLTGNNAFGPKRMVFWFAVPLAVVASQWLLRRVFRPGAPGVGRALGVGGLTAVLAAGIGTACLLGLARGAGEAAQELNRRELLEIAESQRELMVKQAGSEAAYQAHLERLKHLTADDLARNDFSKILLLGLLFGLPAGVFLRE